MDNEAFPVSCQSYFKVVWSCLLLYLTTWQMWRCIKGRGRAQHVPGCLATLDASYDTSAGIQLETATAELLEVYDHDDGPSAAVAHAEWP